MKLEGTFLRSKIARRIVLLFVLSALVPAVAIAVLSLSQVQQLLAKEGHVALARAGGSYAASLLDRLLIADQQAIDIADRVRSNAARNPDFERRLQRQFKGMAVIDAYGQRTPLIGVLTEVPLVTDVDVQHLALGNATLTTILDEGGPARTYLRRAIDVARPLERTLVAEIDPAYLFGDASALPAMTDICVSNEHGKVLYCSPTEGPAAIGDVAGPPEHSSADRFTFRRDGEALLADRRELFLRPWFLIRGWSVLAVSPKAEALMPAASFRAIFLPVLALSLLVVSLLSLTQVRRTLGPLEKLIAGTRRAADRDFTARVEIHGNDEFGELATAFNTMAQRLGSQFRALNTLADIDHAILARLELERIAETVVLRMHEIVPADYVSVVIRDRHSGDFMSIYSRDQVHLGRVEIERCPCVAAEVRELLLHPDGVWPDLKNAGAAYFAPVVRLGAEALCAFPIVWQQEVVGVVVMGFAKTFALDVDMRARARDLGDRLGVAFATAAKDEQLYYQANYDALTGLPNRLYFKDRLTQMLVQAHRERSRLALLFIDLDQFKNINDSLGHAAGDEALRQAAERLRRCTRESDSIARLGGDEFTVIVSQLKSVRDLEIIAEHILESLRPPFTIDGKEHFLSASIGIAIYPADGIMVDDLLRNADLAMYRAKEGGRDRFVYFEEKMNAVTVARLALDRDLRHALERGEFSLVYQPQQDLRRGHISGAEALLRWHHPELGVLAPPAFIEVAEETGLIESIGAWVLDEACRQFLAWRAQGVAIPRIAVNVSARQFKQKNFVERVEAIICKSGMNPHDLDLEITESLLVENDIGVQEILARLRDFGLRLALDDFGTGYSSLAYLKRFDVGIVKIDRAFVKDLPADESSAAITTAIIAMAHALEKEVVAEGVESEQQRGFLGRLGCDHIQGFQLSHPLTADEFAAFARQLRRSQRGESTVFALASHA